MPLTSKTTAAIAALLLASSALMAGCAQDCPRTTAEGADSAISAFDPLEKGGGGGGGGGHGGGGGGHSGGGESSGGSHTSGEDSSPGSSSKSFFSPRPGPGQPGYVPSYPWYLMFDHNAQVSHCKKQPQH